MDWTLEQERVQCLLLLPWGKWGMVFKRPEGGQYRDSAVHHTHPLLLCSCLGHDWLATLYFLATVAGTYGHLTKVLLTGHESSELRAPGPCHGEWGFPFSSLLPPAISLSMDTPVWQGKASTCKKASGQRFPNFLIVSQCPFHEKST